MEKAPAGSLPRAHWPTAALGRVCSSPELRMERHKTFQGMALTWVWSLTPRKPTASQQLTLWKRPKRVNEHTLNNSWFKLFSVTFVFLFPPPFCFCLITLNMIPQDQCWGWNWKLYSSKCVPNIPFFTELPGAILHSHNGYKCNILFCNKN